MLYQGIMKILKLNVTQPLDTTQKFIKAYFKADLNAFKYTSRQFLRNNQVYSPQPAGFFAWSIYTIIIYLFNSKASEYSEALLYKLN